MMASKVVLAMAIVMIAVPVCGIQERAFEFREDFGQEYLYDCALQYYYSIPCPTYSWFWAVEGWSYGDIVGQWFEIGDVSMGGYSAASPTDCHTLESIRVVDFAGYGQVHPGMFSVEFDVYCADEHGCPVGPSLWNSGRYDTKYGWNYIDVLPPISICECSVMPGPPPAYPRILITATHTGYEAYYPAWGLDNISTPVLAGCAMHDIGCLPAPYPRPHTSHYSAIHSGYYGNGTIQYCPPQWFLDHGDTTPDGSRYGFIELAWRIYLLCTGPTGLDGTTWGDIKSMYR